MRFKQTAALGLSALLLSGNTLLPASDAASMLPGNEGNINHQFKQMISNPMLNTLIKGRSMLQPKPATVFGHLHQSPQKRTPVAQHPVPAKTARSLPITAQAPVKSVIVRPASATRAVKPLASSQKASTAAPKKVAAASPHTKNAVKPITTPNIQAQPVKTTQPENIQPVANRFITPVNQKAPNTIAKLQEPTLDNGSAPAHAPKIETVADNTNAQTLLKPLEPKQTEATTATASTTQATSALAKATTPVDGHKKATQTAFAEKATLPVEPLDAPQQATKSQPTSQEILAAAEQAVVVAAPEPKETQPKYQAIYQARDPKQNYVAKTVSSEENFNMLAASPLDQLVMQSKATAAPTMIPPRLDNSPPEADVFNNGKSVKVLKSSISQKVANIDLAIGKAEVIYLSRPASRVSVSNPEVASAVIISPTQIQLTGKAIGVANLLVWGDIMSPDHTVVDISVHRDVSVLISQLKYVDPGIQIVPMAAEDTVILTGQAETRETAQLAIEMAKAFFSKNSVGAPHSNVGPNSQAPGSALPGLATNVINLIKIKGEPSTKLELVRTRLKEIDPNIRIEVVPGPEGNEKVILTGRVGTASIASKALNLASVFYGQPGLKVVTAQGGNEFTRMENTNNQSGGGSGSSSSSSSSSGGGGTANGAVNILQGSVLTDATGNVISMLEIAQKPQIRCSIKFLELTKNSLNALGGTISGYSGNTGGASWSGAQSPAPSKPIATHSSQDPSGSAFRNIAQRATGSNSNSNTVQSVFNEVYQNGITQVLTINNQLAAAIQALQERRQVRTLAEPTLTMLSGEQGSFLAGGEIPIAFVGGQGQVSIEYHEFGIRLNLLPSVTDDGKIQMQVSPEVSALDQSNGVSTNSISVPAFTTRRMNTTLLVEPGQSFILAGLYNQQDTDSISRFPGLGSIPVLGTFFRNKWDNRTSSEMVVVIKPEIINTNTGNTTSHANQFLESQNALSHK